jgi:D-3-phosphoglycerate dehydrogenase / 2-oxoglutarate reductase
MILIVDEMHPSIFGMLEEAGLAYDYRPAIKRDELLSIVAQYTGLIIRSKTTIDTEFLHHAPQLKFIGRAGAGLDLIDLDAVAQRNIQVFAANEGNRDAVAEHAVGMLLCLFNHLHTADREVRTGLWKREKNRGIELMGKTVGIIGYGNNGRATAKRLSAFGVRVLVYDKYLENYTDQYSTEATLAHIQAEADILSFHIPLTDETNQWLNTETIAQFAKPFFLVNVARGELVNLSAVLSALQTGKIRGACLDVLENEKLNKLSNAQQHIYQQLFELPNVVFSPHIAGWTFESYERINRVLVDKIQAQ